MTRHAPAAVTGALAGLAEERPPCTCDPLLTATPRGPHGAVGQHGREPPRHVLPHLHPQPGQEGPLPHRHADQAVEGKRCLPLEEGVEEGLKPAHLPAMGVRSRRPSSPRRGGQAAAPAMPPPGQPRIGRVLRRQRRGRPTSPPRKRSRSPPSPRPEYGHPLYPSSKRMHGSHER